MVPRGGRSRGLQGTAAYELGPPFCGFVKASRLRRLFCGWVGGWGGGTRLLRFRVSVFSFALDVGFERIAAPAVTYLCLVACIRLSATTLLN